MEKIFVILWILLCIYILVLLMIFADLWSGVRTPTDIGVPLAKWHNTTIS